MVKSDGPSLYLRRVKTALIQCATAELEQYFPVLSEGQSPEDYTGKYCSRAG